MIAGNGTGDARTNTLQVLMDLVDRRDNPYCHNNSHKHAIYLVGTGYNVPCVPEFFDVIIQNPILLLSEVILKEQGKRKRSQYELK